VHLVLVGTQNDHIGLIGRGSLDELGRLMSDAGHEVKLAGGAQEILQAEAGHAHDACFVAAEAIAGCDPEDIRSLRARAPELPLIVVAAGATREDERDALLAGADAILDDPGDVDGALDLVRSLAMHRERLSACHGVAADRKVLVVDDDVDFVLPVVREVMERAGLAVVTATNAEEGLRLMRSNAFSLLLTDLRMPGLGGREMLEAALLYDPRVVPVVMTGFASLDSAIACLRAGAADFVTKPFDTNALAGVMERAWRRSLLSWTHVGGRGDAAAGLKILVVGQASVPEERLGEILAQTGDELARIDHAASLDDGAARLPTGDYDAVLVDIDAPGRDLEDYARIHSAAAGVPIVALTSKESDATAERMLVCGAADFLVRDNLSPELLLARLRHVTERQRVLADLERLATDTYASDLGRWQVIERSLDAMLIASLDGTVMAANPAAETLFGRPAEEIVGRPMDASLAASGDAPVDIARPDGARRLAEVRASRTAWRNRPTTLYTIRDVTDRGRAEELERRLVHADRLASIGQLAAGVAHEINNPLAYLIGNTALMKDLVAGMEAAVDELSALASEGGAVARRPAEVMRRHRLTATMDEMREMLEDNLSGLERIRKVTRNLNVFSRVERDHVDKVRLNDVVDTACDLSFNDIRHRARLVKDLNEVPPIAGDESKLCQVLVNLLVNAAHSIEPGDAARNQIKIETLRGRDHIEVRVSDTGEGIAQEQLSRIFEPFFTTKPRGVGTGLGLSLCSEIVRQHGGEIGVDSKVGAGTCFTLYLPLNTGLGLGSSEEADQTLEEDAPAEDRLRILVVDDDVQVARSVRRMLQSHYDVVVAPGGPEALAILEKDQAFDAILCDLMMPDTDGVAVYEHLCQSAPALASKLAFVSGGALGERLAYLDKKDRPALLKKPFEPAKLRTFIEALASGASDLDTLVD
jgi:signal transduction histidine kinase/FixJ family two-component response regulator